MCLDLVCDCLIVLLEKRKQVRPFYEPSCFLFSVPYGANKFFWAEPFLEFSLAAIFLTGDGLVGGPPVFGVVVNADATAGSVSFFGVYFSFFAVLFVFSNVFDVSHILPPLAFP